MRKSIRKRSSSHVLAQAETLKLVDGKYVKNSRHDILAICSKILNRHQDIEDELDKPNPSLDELRKLNGRIGKLVMKIVPR